MKILHCFFAWKRPELTEKCFIDFLSHISEDDKVLVIDQENSNLDMFSKYMDKIDFFTSMKMNYHIGPVWMYIRNFLVWKRDCRETYLKNKEHGWFPDYVNIVESDAICKEGYLDKLLVAMDKDKSIGLISGFDGADLWPTIAFEHGVVYKNVISGVQVLVETHYFIKIAHYFQKYCQDKHICIRNKNNNKRSAIVPYQVEHLGDDCQTRDEKIDDEWVEKK